MTDQGNRMEGFLTEGSNKAIAGFSSEFSAAFPLPDGHKIIRLDLGSGSLSNHRVMHMDLPPEIPAKTYKDAGVLISEPAAFLTNDCATTLTGRSSILYGLDRKLQ